MLESLILNLDRAGLPATLEPETLLYINFNYVNNGILVNQASGDELSTGSVELTSAGSIRDGVAVGKYSGDYAIIAQIPEPILSGDYTMELWFEVPAAKLGSTMILMSNMRTATSGNSSSSTSAGIFESKNYYFSVGLNNARISSTAAVGDLWQHVCVMRVSGHVYCFVNGNPIYNFAHTSSITATNFGVGGYESASSGASRRYFTGKIADAAITKKARYAITGFTPAYPIFK